MRDSLCYKVSTKPADSSFRDAEYLLRPITAMPAVHPFVVDDICSVSHDPGGLIPASTLIPVRWNNNYQYSQCKVATGAEMFYSYDFPYKYSANTGYYVRRREWNSQCSPQRARG